MTAPGRENARDPGAQPERTRLAWRRTTLTYTVSLALGARTVISEGVPALGVVALACAALAWVGLLLVASRRSHALDRTPSSGPRTADAEVRATVVCTLVLIAAGAATLA